jgi:hypothetical protein
VGKKKYTHIHTHTHTHPIFTLFNKKEKRKKKKKAIYIILKNIIIIYILKKSILINFSSLNRLFLVWDIPTLITRGKTQRYTIITGGSVSSKPVGIQEACVISKPFKNRRVRLKIRRH